MFWPLLLVRRLPDTCFFSYNYTNRWVVCNSLKLTSPFSHFLGSSSVVYCCCFFIVFCLFVCLFSGGGVGLFGFFHCQFVLTFAKMCMLLCLSFLFLSFCWCCLFFVCFLCFLFCFFVVVVVVVGFFFCFCFFFFCFYEFFVCLFLFLFFLLNFIVVLLFRCENNHWKHWNRKTIAFFNFVSLPVFSLSISFQVAFLIVFVHFSTSLNGIYWDSHGQ